MPILVRGLLRSQAPPPSVVAGLALSGLGDVALLGESEGAFGLGLLSFLVAHGCYLTALWTQRAGGIKRHPGVAALYGATWVGLNVLLWPRTGKLKLPVLVYGVALAVMALAALDTGDPVLAAGGAAFLVSDSLLAVDTFVGPGSSTADAAVMLTYTTAQALIAYGMGRD
jgi:uncharacterized membrane protein YhhN